MSDVAGAVHAVFDAPGDARDAVERLCAAGFEPREIEIRSSVPIRGVEAWCGMLLRSRAVLAAVGGALIGGVSGYLVASLTALDYPIVTGGMPIVSPMPVGIITYEFVALGAMLATVGTVFLEGRLRPRFRVTPGPLDRHVAEGRILVTAPCRDDVECRKALVALERAREVREARDRAPSSDS